MVKASTEGAALNASQKLSVKEKIGYALGDAAGLSLFSLIGSVLQKHYTDILGIAAKALTPMFMIARIWDAINDPIWGRVIDTRKPSPLGRYRKWLLYMAVPLALSGVLMFVRIPGLSPFGYLAYIYATYILFGMLYTTINIPYGSLASVMTTDEKDRSTLSILHSVGSGVGGLPVMGLASLCYVTVSPGGKEMSYHKLLAGVAVISVFCMLMYIVSFRWTKERIVPVNKPKAQKGDTTKILASLLKSRAFVSLCAASMLLIAVQMFTQTYYNYLFDDYFHRPELYMLVMICTYFPMALLVLVTNKLVSRFGKKCCVRSGFCSPTPRILCCSSFKHKALPFSSFFVP